MLKQLFGSMGENVSVGLPFICDYGRNIHIGTNVSVNMNCTFVDCNKIEIGDNVLTASNVQIYTATHPVELSDRLTPDWDPDSGEYFCRTYALPVKIGNGCWIGGGAILLPGVSIGDGTVIGAGSVATKGMPFYEEEIPCPVAACVMQKGLSFCGECTDFPCQLLTDYSNDTEHGDNPPGARITACKMIKCLLEKK